eukprot:EG_transcript_13998
MPIWSRFRNSPPGLRNGFLAHFWLFIWTVHCVQIPLELSTIQNLVNQLPYLSLICQRRQGPGGRIKAIIRECFLAIKPLVVHSFRSETHDLLCYQVFGFDFMMDDSFETWLIEIN